jgi:hypothetical protein
MTNWSDFVALMVMVTVLTDRELGAACASIHVPRATHNAIHKKTTLRICPSLVCLPQARCRPNHRLLIRRRGLECPASTPLSEQGIP